MTSAAPRPQAPRVMLVIDDGTRPSERSVARRQWIPIVRALQDHGVSVTLVTTGGPGEVHREAAGVGAGTAALRRRGRYDILGPAIRMMRLLRRLPIDLIHANEVLPTLTAGLGDKMTRGRPHIFHRHHTFSSYKHELASYVAARLSDVTLAYSHAVAEAAMTWDRTPSSAIRQVPAGILPLEEADLTEVAELRRDLGIDMARMVVVVVARLRPEKGIDVLIEAQQLAHEDVDVVVVGSGPDERGLKALASRYDLSHVHFVGHRDDVGAWFSLADIVAVPSTQESFGLVAVEAMSVGRPVVASKVGGLKEIVRDGETGMHCQPGDADDLARAIDRLAVSPELRMSMGEAGRECFEQRFSLDAMVRGWRGVYEELIVDHQRVRTGP